LIGPYDLSTSLGIPGQFDNAKFRDATRQVVGACERHGKAAVLATIDVGELCAGPSNGFRMLMYLADIWIYQQALSRCFRSIRESLDIKGRPVLPS
jgi:2-keto-3-deoxy-L-rhamnonate aldolase RhmA